MTLYKFNLADDISASIIGNPNNKYLLIKTSESRYGSETFSYPLSSDIKPDDIIFMDSGDKYDSYGDYENYYIKILEKSRIQSNYLT